MHAFFESEQAWIQGLLTPEAINGFVDRPDAKFRAVFISDIHLGTQGCQAEALLQFLKAYPSDYL